MKYFFSHLLEIQKKLNLMPACLLVLDFDGTLAPIKPTPDQVVLPEAVKICLKDFANFGRLPLSAADL